MSLLSSVYCLSFSWCSFFTVECTLYLLLIISHILRYWSVWLFRILFRTLMPLLEWLGSHCTYLNFQFHFRMFWITPYVIQDYLPSSVGCVHISLVVYSALIIIRIHVYPYYPYTLCYHLLFSIFPCVELCECRISPWPAYTYLLFTSCFPTLDPSYFPLRAYVGTSAGFLVWGFHTSLTLDCYTELVLSRCTLLTFHSYILPHVISGIIIFWTNILLLFFCYLCWFLYKKSISVFDDYMDSSSRLYSLSLPLWWCAFLMASLGHKGFSRGFILIFMSLMTSF